MTRRLTESSQYLMSFLPFLFVIGGCTAPAPSYSSGGNMQSGQSRQDQIARGRFVVISHDCGGCHGGGSNPAAFGFPEPCNSQDGPHEDQQG